MAGVVLETLSTKKLTVLILSLFLCLLGFFLIGGLVGKNFCVCVHFVNTMGHALHAYSFSLRCWALELTILGTWSAVC